MKKTIIILASILITSLTNPILAAGDAEAGQAKSATCMGCHGENGRSKDESIPSLAGKDVDWIVQQLEYFQSGERQNAYMNAMAPMAEGFEQSIAEYLAIQDPQK